MRRFLHRVAATVARHRMICPGQTVLVALSAGPDSSALLHALVQLQDRLGCRVRACHVHHGLRGEEADADADHAFAFAKNLGVPCAIVRAEVRKFASEHRLSLEAAGRQVRYQVLEREAESCKAARIATGHTADDQAETVLLNLLRGTGPAGLAGIAPVREQVIRPLLEASREQVERYCQAVNLSYRLDPSNRDLRFARNRIRHQILPALRQIQPRVTEVLCRLAQVMRAENEFVLAQARAHAEWLELNAPERLVIPLKEFAELHPALQRRVAKEAIARARGEDRDIEMERAEALVRLLTSARTGARIQLPGGLAAVRSYQEVTIAAPEEDQPPPTGEWELPVPTEIEVGELGVRFRTSYSKARRPPHNPHVALVDADQVKEPLRVRTWRPGDRFVPYGMAQPVKLQDYFVNLKVPQARRHWVPLVLCGDRILWVVGHRVSDEFKVTAQTRRTIRIEATERFVRWED